MLPGFSSSKENEISIWLAKNIKHIKNSPYSGAKNDFLITNTQFRGGKTANNDRFFRCNKKIHLTITLQSSKL